MKRKSKPATSPRHVWIVRGFEAFRRGSFGNAGQNLYVSCAGVLQRIHCFGLRRDGNMDLIFCNSQNHWERPPAYVYHDPLGAARRVELPSDGARAGIVADLNSDGFDDLVLGMFYNGVRFDLNAIIYYGSPEGLSERRQQLLPAPKCTAIAAGDFNGDGRPDLAFLCDGKVRLFNQTELGFEPKRFLDLAIAGEQLGSHDLDGNGAAELIVRDQKGNVRVYWGGATGINPENVSEIPSDTAPSGRPPKSGGEVSALTPYAESVPRAHALVKVVVLNQIPHIFAARPTRAVLVPVRRDRHFGPPLEFDCSKALSIAVGDFNGDGQSDLVLACQEKHGSQECSWVYWGGPEGFDESRRTRLESTGACDVAAGDLDGDGFDDIVLCQHHSEDSFTTHSIIHRGGPKGIRGDAASLLSEDARRVFVARTCPDAKPQIIFVNHHSRERLGNIPVSIYTGGSNGFSTKRRIQRPGWGAVDALFCDVNDDGWPDLILANASENSISHDPGSYLYLNGPRGLPAHPSAILPTARAMNVVCADLNRDGHLDLIFSGFANPELLILHGTPGGFDTANPRRIRIEQEGQPCMELRGLLLADLNNDGWLDLFVPDISRDRSLILWGSADGFSLERSQPLSVWHACCARAADLTGNGCLDLIVGGHAPSDDKPHDSHVYVYWNGPEGLREDRRTLLPANAVNAISVADFNRDGLLDLFVTSYHGVKDRDIPSFVYWNRPERGFSAADRTRLFTHSASASIAADFNRDGWIDLAIANHKIEGDHAGWSEIWWNGPKGFDQSRTTRLPTEGPHGMISVEPANILDRSNEEHYVSEPFQLTEGRRVSGISWKAKASRNTWVRAQLRFAETRERLDEAAWVGPSREGDWFDAKHPRLSRNVAGRWIQFRLELGAHNACATPRVTEVRVQFRKVPKQ